MLGAKTRADAMPAKPSTNAATSVVVKLRTMSPGKGKSAHRNAVSIRPPADMLGNPHSANMSPNKEMAAPRWAPGLDIVRKDEPLHFAQNLVRRNPLKHRPGIEVKLGVVCVTVAQI